MAHIACQRMPIGLSFDCSVLLIVFDIENMCSWPSWLQWWPFSSGVFKAAIEDNNNS
jgi:hypothetical protein